VLENLKIYLCYILIFTASTGLYAEPINPNKQELWDAMSTEVSHWIDGAGYPIDKEIKETVIALNLMGIETIASCEGHLDHGSLYPWIELQIYLPETKKMMHELSEVQEQMDNEETLLKIKFPNLTYNDFYHLPEAQNLKHLRNKHNLIAESIEQNQIKCLEPLNQLLNQFYENRKSSYDSTLIIARNSSACLHSIGVDRQQIRSQREQIFNLKKYQEEMKAFTDFLKQKL